MDYLPLSDNAARQIIDASTIFEEWQRVDKEARPYVGGMYWKRQGKYEYLVKTLPDNRQNRIGPRSAKTEAIFKNFTGRKTAIEARLKSLQAALKEAERLNKAVKAGRVPSKVVAVLQALEDSGLGEQEWLAPTLYTLMRRLQAFLSCREHLLRRTWTCCGMPDDG